MESILIVNAVIVNEGDIATGDVYIEAGRISQIGPDLASRAADRVIDAQGNVLLPGMIDDQVHFREPGLTHKGDLVSESRAAVAGGITSYMEMPNTQPPTTTEEQLESKFQSAAGRSHANYSFYLGATNDNLQEIKALDPLSSCGVKVFMGSSTGNLLVDDMNALEGIFAHSPVIIATHCEDDALININAQRCREKYGEDVPMSEHPRIRSEEACYRSTRQAVELARSHDCRLHILHLSTARELSLLSNLPPDEKRITAEVCVHHLFFDETAYAEKGTRIKCNPAIKSPADREALLQAVVDGRIDVIATDHAPHTLAEKQRSYFQAPAGLPLVQHALVCLLEHYHDGRLSLPLIAEKTAHTPAKLFQLKDRGYIREGYWADLTLVDTRRSYRVDEHLVFAHCGWTPFDGFTFRSHIDTTIVSGQLAYRNGRIVSPPAGMRLEFDR
jgi:dihydroorotase